ncbi:glutathione transferase GstA [Thalassospira profundimaris]|uniref:Glutathione S-transferase n=1 Tax=Thalassospira profundimaris TaxID=502049 RepID=A0A367WHP6_9PROT|nr:glutathione transferase GstA [Thalassospira profundimaris]RCK40944.1 glutathione S-transferase [Thalassospira profundimaris]
MKLYYLPGACSLASHIMLHEVGAQFDIERVDTKEGRTESGRAYREISPNGYVPALEIETGDYLTEGVAVLQHIADTHPERAFSPKPGSVARARLQQFLNFAAAELHKSWGPLFTDGASAAEQDAAKAKVATKFDHLESVLSDGRDYLVENRFSVADAYTFVLVNWASFKEIDLSNWPNLAGFVARIQARPATLAAMKAEGLV